MNKKSTVENYGYPDSKSLGIIEPESLTETSNRVVNLNVLNSLRLLFTVNPTQLRRLWLLLQYCDYRVNLDFHTGRSIVRNYVEKNALRARDPEYITGANRRQVLGAFREQKIISFIEYFFYIYKESNQEFNIFEFAANASIDELIASSHDVDFMSDSSNPNLWSLQFVNSIYGKRFRLPKVIWDILHLPCQTQEQMNTKLSLMQSLQIQLPRTVSSSTGKVYDLSQEFEYFAGSPYTSSQHESTLTVEFLDEIIEQ